MNSRNPTYTPTGMPSSPYCSTSRSLYAPLDADEYDVSAAPSTMMQPNGQGPQDQFNNYYQSSQFNTSYAQTFVRDSYPPPQSMNYRQPYPFGTTPTYPTYHPAGMPATASNLNIPARDFRPVSPIVFHTVAPYDAAANLSSGTHYNGAYHQPTFAPIAPVPGLEMIEGLFGTGEPRAITINGSPEAITRLREGIIIDRLIVNRRSLDCHEAFTASLEHLQAKGAIADPENKDMGDKDFNLDGMTWDERAALDITPSDFAIDPANSVHNSVKPPFHGNVDSLLGLLRVMAKYHDFSPGTCYQLGVVTKDGEEDHHVQLFKAQKGAEAKHTVWLYRECLRDLVNERQWIEVWHPFIQNPDNTPAGDAFVDSSMHFSRKGKGSMEPNDNLGYSNLVPSSPLDSKRRRTTASTTTKAKATRGRPRKATSQASPTAAPFMAPSLPMALPQMTATPPLTLPRIPPRHHWSGAQHEQDNVHLFNHLTDEEILSGAVHPDDICGTLMLRLVRNHSNSELHTRINDLHRRISPTRPKSVSPGCITKRWTLALQHICKRDGLDYLQQRARYHAVRRRNGIAGGGDYDGTPSVQKPRKRKDSAVKAEKKPSLKRDDSLNVVEDDDAEFEADDEGEDDSIDPALMTASRVRRARKSVNYAAVAEGFEESQDEEDHQEHERRPAKRVKRYAEEEDDGSEFEQEDDDGGWL